MWRRTSPMEQRFQSTLPRGERRYTPEDWQRSLYFNPRSREGSDNELDTKYQIGNNFNPRSREGSDLDRLFDFRRECRISIHAPARGATQNHHVLQLQDDHFNPRSREGSDAESDAGGEEYINSNPRPREGSDGDGRSWRDITEIFQSTLPRGERQRIPGRIKRYRTISIHAPARGATYCKRFRHPSCIIQSTLPRGERPE